MSIKPTILSKFDQSNISTWKHVYISEKFDGWRLIYNQGKFYTRSGKILNLPTQFLQEIAQLLKNCPDLILDGELWMGYGKSGFDQIQTYQIFDLIDLDFNFTQRYHKLQELFQQCSSFKLLKLVEHQFHLVSQSIIDQELTKVVTRGGEGITLRHPHGKYLTGLKSLEVCKLKPLETTELLVMGYHTTQHMREHGCEQDYVSSLICYTDQGQDLRITIKSTNPPPIGSLIEIRYSDVTVGGLPKFPVYQKIIEEHCLDTERLLKFEELRHQEALDLKITLNIGKTNKWSLPENQIRILIKNKKFKGIVNITEVKDRPILKGGEFVLLQSKNNIYKVACAMDGRSIYCGCPSWIYAKMSPRLRSCKHCRLFSIINLEAPI